MSSSTRGSDGVRQRERARRRVCDGRLMSGHLGQRRGRVEKALEDSHACDAGGRLLASPLGHYLGALGRWSAQAGGSLVGEANLAMAASLDLLTHVLRLGAFLLSVA